MHNDRSLYQHRIIKILKGLHILFMQALNYETKFVL